MKYFTFSMHIFLLNILCCEALITLSLFSTVYGVDDRFDQKNINEEIFVNKKNGDLYVVDHEHNYPIRRILSQEGCAKRNFYETKREKVPLPVACQSVFPVYLHITNVGDTQFLVYATHDEDKSHNELYVVKLIDNKEFNKNELMYKKIEIADAMGNLHQGNFGDESYVESKIVGIETAGDFVFIAMAPQVAIDGINQGSWGDHGSGLAVVKIIATQNSIRLIQYDAQNGSNSDHPRAIHINKSTPELRVGKSLSFFSSEDPLLHWNSDLKSLYIGIREVSAGPGVYDGVKSILIAHCETSSNVSGNLIGKINFSNLTIDDASWGDGMQEETQNFVGVKKSFGRLSLHNLTTMCTKNGYYYLLINGGNGSFDDTENIIASLPLCDVNGALARVDVSDGTVFFESQARSDELLSAKSDLCENNNHVPCSINAQIDASNLLANIQDKPIIAMNASSDSLFVLTKSIEKNKFGWFDSELFRSIPHVNVDKSIRYWSSLKKFNTEIDDTVFSNRVDFAINENFGSMHVTPSFGSIFQKNSTLDYNYFDNYFYCFMNSDKQFAEKDDLWSTSVAFSARFGYANSSYNGDGARDSLLNRNGIFNMAYLFDGPAIITSADASDSVLKNLYDFRVNPANGQRNPTFACLKYAGTFYSCDLGIHVTQQLPHRFFIQGELPLKYFHITDTSFIDQSPDALLQQPNKGDAEWTQFLTMFDVIKQKYNINTNPVHKIGFGDLRISGGWNFVLKDWMKYQHIPDFNSSFYSFLKFPTSPSKNYTNVFEIPLGNDTHFSYGFGIQSNIHLNMLRGISLQVHIHNELFAKKNMLNIPMNTSLRQNGEIRLFRGDAIRKYGNKFVVGLAINYQFEAHPWTISCGYSYSTQEKTIIIPYDTKKFQYEKVNSDTALLGYSMHVLHAQCNIALPTFAKIPYINYRRAMQPVVGLFYERPFVGYRIFAVNNFGARGGIIISHAF